MDDTIAAPAPSTHPPLDCEHENHRGSDKSGGRETNSPSLLGTESNPLYGRALAHKLA